MGKDAHAFSISVRAEADPVLSCLARAFSADPVIRWFCPEPAAFLAHFPRVADLFGGRAFEHAAAYRSDDFMAAALWLPPGVHPDEERLIPQFETTVAAGKLGRLFSLFAAVLPATLAFRQLKSRGQMSAPSRV